MTIQMTVPKRLEIIYNTLEVGKCYILDNLINQLLADLKLHYVITDGPVDFLLLNKELTSNSVNIMTFYNEDKVELTITIREGCYLSVEQV